MKYSTKIHTCFLVLSFALLLNACSEKQAEKAEAGESANGNLKIGWGFADITPDQPVIIRSMWVSEGVLDPVTATVLILESGSGPSSEKAVMISCDLISIPDGMRDGLADNLRDNVRKMIAASIPEISPDEIFLNATHTHVAPAVSPESAEDLAGVELDVMSPKQYQDMVCKRIVTAAEKAWNDRKPGGISFGLGYAVAGNNRLQVDFDGTAQMHGSMNRPEFSHLEGFVDHTVNLLYTWDTRKNLTGVIVNLACTSQVKYGYLISSDFWHETREELGQRLGKDVYILPQTSAAGDLSPHDLLIDRKGEERMQALMFPDLEQGRNSMARRKQIAMRISDAVTSVLPYTKDSIEWSPAFAHQMEKVELTRLRVTQADVDNALKSYPGLKEGETFEFFKKQYEQSLLEVKNNPALKEKPRWYSTIAKSHGMMKRALALKESYEVQDMKPKIEVEVHVLRIGDVAMATNPFELYADYGMRIKARSPAVQTFVVQLAGGGTYLPTERAVKGGAYGAVPASNLVGPQGGQELVESTLNMIHSLWGVKSTPEKLSSKNP